MVKKVDFREFEAMDKGSYDMAILISGTDEGKEHGTRDVEAFVFAPDEADVTDTICRMAGASALFVVDLAGGRRQQQAMLLLEYMRRFVDTGMELTGEDIPDRIFEVPAQGGSHNES